MMLMARNATAAEKVRRHVALSAGVTALGGLLFGYDTGVVSGALLFVKKDFGGLSSFQEELITSLLLVGAVVGALLAGRVADLIGRRLTVLITAVIFVVGVLLAAFTPTFPVLLVARIVIGLAVGSASMVVPLYIGEVVPPRVRGGLVSLNQLAITAGILVSYLIDYGLSGSANWRLMFGLAAIPAVLLFVGMLFQKESPHWLIRQGRIDEARDVLKRVRNDDDIDAEIHDVQEVSRKQAGVRELLSPSIRPLVFVGVMLAVFQQITGINTVIYYAPTLLQGAGFGSSAALLANVVNGAVNVGMTIVAIWLLDRAGRRPLLLSGTAGMAVGMAITGVRLPRRREPARGAGHRRGGRPARLHRVVRDRAWPGVLAADRGDLPAPDPRCGDERGDHGQLGRQLRRHGLVPDAAERDQRRRRVLPVRLPHAGRAGVLLAQGARDEGAQPAGDRARAHREQGLAQAQPVAPPQPDGWGGATVRSDSGRPQTESRSSESGSAPAPTWRSWIPAEICENP